MIKKIVISSIIVSFLAGGFSCASLSKKEKGAIIGATSGGVIGGIIGKKSGSTAIGAILGAAIGGAAGAYIGNYMDKQAKEMERDLEGAKITRVGEGIKVTFDSGIMFDVNKATLKPASKKNLANLAQILNKYPDTNILLEGHTDASGSDEYNLNLSKLRSQSVSNELAGLGVRADRLIIRGYGEEQPVADNETEIGRAQNRRVEVAIYANDKLKKVAQERAG
jgi:outer membrane protein OmpA-like peptidoglycan-associated protein